MRDFARRYQGHRQVRQSEVYHQQRTYADAFPCERPRGWRDTVPLLREGAELGTRETREQLIRNKDAPWRADHRYAMAHVLSFQQRECFLVMLGMFSDTYLEPTYLPHK